MHYFSDDLQKPKIIDLYQPEKQTLDPDTLLQPVASLRLAEAVGRFSGCVQMWPSFCSEAQAWLAGLPDCSTPCSRMTPMTLLEAHDVLLYEVGG
jgi:hypothetical protein